MAAVPCLNRRDVAASGIANPNVAMSFKLSSPNVNDVPNVDKVPTEWATAASQRLRWNWQTTRIAGRDWPLAVATDPDAMLIDACERQDAGEEADGFHQSGSCRLGSVPG